MKTTLLSLLVLASVLTAMCQGQKEKDEALLSPKEFQTKTGEIKGRLLDVRTPKEYKSGYIANSENINFFDKGFKDQIKALPKDKTYFVYCRSGGRSGKTCTMMREAGFEHVYDLDGGITAWQKEGLPVKKDE